LFDSANALGIEIKSISDLKAIREERERTPASYSEYDASDFILSFDWFTSFGGRRVSVDAVFLYGGSGLGKTEFAVSRFGQFRSDGSRELGCLLVRRLDQAKDYSPVHYSGVVFDDVDLSNCSAEEKIHMLD
jgi:Holliday junction resolvasome RuvABC ATP-dependent DNA helicase subunit